MKYYSQRLCKWAIFLLVLSLLWVGSAEEKGNQFSSVSPRLRGQLNACQDGNYPVDGKTCCLCAAGERLLKHCTVKPEDRSCDHCEIGKTYNSRPNSEPECEPCTSCAHPNANLEVKEECTTASDAVCQCKDGYYCSSETCNSCNPCEKCEGKTVKKHCMGTDNTVCEEKSEGTGKAVRIAIGVIVGLAAIAAIAATGICWWTKRFCFKKTSGEMRIHGSSETDPSAQRLPLVCNDGDFSRLVPDIADVVGWAEMKNVAMRDGFTDAAIENHRLNHPTDAREQTIGLLMEWGEKHGREALRMLVDKLHENRSNAKAEKVQGIIERNRPSRTQPVPN